MRSLSNLCLFMILFCCGLNVHAAITGRHEARTASSSTRAFLQILSHDRQLKHHGRHPSRESIITTSQQSIIASGRTDTREGADTAREHFLAGINIFSCKVQAVRLLAYLHAIIRSLIFPQHIFW